MTRREADLVFTAMIVVVLALIFMLAGYTGAHLPSGRDTAPIGAAVWSSGVFWLCAGILPLFQKVAAAWQGEPGPDDRPLRFEVAGAVSNGFAAAAATFAGIAALQLT